MMSTRVEPESGEKELFVSLYFLFLILLTGFKKVDKTEKNKREVNITFCGGMCMILWK